LRSADDVHSLRGLWGLYAVGAVDENLVQEALSHRSPWVRSWAVRLLGEAGPISEMMQVRLSMLAASDKAAEVRLQLASTAQRLPRDSQDAVVLLENLMCHKEDASDPCIPLMIWLAYEPRLVKQRTDSLDRLRKNAAGNPLVANEIVPRVMRRLVATGSAADLAACVAFLEAVQDPARRRPALEGLLVARPNPPPDPPGARRPGLA